MSVLHFITFVNNLFIFFAESTDNFVSSKSALLCFEADLLILFGNYQIQVVLFPDPPASPDPWQPRASE